MKILVVVDSINKEDSSGSKANVALIQNLFEAGFDVMVYHYTLKTIELAGVSCFAIPEIKYSLLYFLSRLQRVLARKFNWNLMPFFEKRFGFSFTFFNDTKSIVKALKKNTFQPDLVLTLSKGASFRPHYAVLKLPKWHGKWMAYVHDPYPFHVYPRPYSWIEPGYSIKEAFIKNVSIKAKYSGFPSHLLKDWMGEYFSNFDKTGIVIPHQNSKFKSNLSTCPDYFDVTQFNLLHAGNLLAQRSPRGLIEGFQLFLSNNCEARKNSKLLLIGLASYHSKMLEAYNKDIPELYVHNGYVPFDLVYYLQMNTSVNVILESKAIISPFLPAKFPHCVESNKPILSLAPYYSETRRLLGNEYPYWSEVDDIEKISFLIGELYHLWRQKPANLLLNRKDLEEYLSVDYLKTVILGLQNK